MLDRVVIGLENSPSDERLVSFINLWKDLFTRSRLYWAHISSNSLEIPLIQGASFQQKPWDERFQDEIYQRISSQLEQINMNDIGILEGNPTDQLIHWTDVKRADLLMLGYHPHAKAHNISINRILRNIAIPVWLVPETPIQHVRNMLIPVDLSTNSFTAVKEALRWAKDLSTLPHLHIMHVFDMPLQSTYQTGYQQQELIEQTKRKLERQIKDFLNNVHWEGLNFTLHPVQNIHHDIARHIHEFSRSYNCEAIVMGAQGHSLVSSFLLGSVTERLVQLIERPALLIVRPEA